MADADPSELDQLRRENARLIGLLEAHGIAWRSSGPARTGLAPFGEGDSEAAPAKGPSSTQEKVTLFRSLFRGRDDVHALRWQSSSSGRSGDAPACANEWRHAHEHRQPARSLAVATPRQPPPMLLYR